MSKVEDGESCFRHGFTCSQAVFSAWAEDLGLEKDMALRIACGFGAGMARTAETCGAVSGALMVIGLKHGKDQSNDSQAKERTYEISRKFMQLFQERNRALRCKELLDCDLSTPEGAKQASERGVFSKLCPKFVRDSLEILEEVL